MAQFSNISHKVDDLTGTDYFKDTVDPWKNWVFAFNAKPKSTVSTSFTWEDRTEWKDGERKDSRKTETKIGKDFEGGKSEWTFGADKFAAKVTKPDLITGDFHVDAHVAGEFKPAKNEWKVELCGHGHTAVYNGIQGWFNKHVEYNNKQEIKLKYSLNFAHEGEHHVGAYFEHDMKDFKKLWAQVGWTPKDSKIKNFVRADLQKHFVSIGHLHHHSDSCHHGVEVTYDAADGAKGLKGLPIGVKFGAEYKLSSATNLKTHVHAAENWGACIKVDHKVDDHWTVSSHQEFSSANLSAKQGPHNLGFKVAYKL